MGAIERAIRAHCQAGLRLRTPTGRGEFTLAEINADGIILLLGEKEARTALTWGCLEGVGDLLKDRTWVRLGGSYTTDADPTTLDGYLKGCTKRATAGWVAALLEHALAVELDRRPPARVRLRS